MHTGYNYSPSANGNLSRAPYSVQGQDSARRGLRHPTSAAPRETHAGHRHGGYSGEHSSPSAYYSDAHSPRPAPPSSSYSPNDELGEWNGVFPTMSQHYNTTRATRSVTPALPGRPGGPHLSSRQLQVPPVGESVEATQEIYPYVIRGMFEDILQHLPGCVPQRIYTPPWQTDIDRYVIWTVLDNPYYFNIPLRDARGHRTGRLWNSNMEVLPSAATCISIRLEWPGYPSWTRQIPTKTFQRNRPPITLGKLAAEVAKVIDLFLQEKRDEVQIGNTEWNVKLFTIDDFILHSLHNVSKGSWQPHLQLRT